MASIAQGAVCKILARHDIKPHKVRYYIERRDEAFETKMAEVLCAYREVAVLRAAELAYEVLPGNTADCTTLRMFLEKEQRYGRARRVWVMDRGIPTEAVLAEMRAGEPCGARKPPRTSQLSWLLLAD